MPRPKLHLDAAASNKILWRALLESGHDVTRTPTDWIALDSSDEEQLLAATAQGRCTCTYDVVHFIRLAERFPHHGGVILASQNRWTLPELITALDRLLSETDAQDWPAQVRWLSDWR